MEKEGFSITVLQTNFCKGMTTMKKLTTLLLAAGLVFAASAPASAVDLKMDGQYLFNFITGERAGTGQNFDNAGQRLRLGMTLTANENLSGYFQVQVGTGKDKTSNYDWGADTTGNSAVIGMRQAYVDWVIPQTVVKVRMGRQLVGLPEDAFGKNAVMHPGWQGRDGIVVTAPATDWLDLTAFWLRGSYKSDGADNFGTGNDTDQSDKTDFFAVVSNFKFDGFSFSPYVMYASVDGGADPDGSTDQLYGSTLGYPYSDTEIGMIRADGNAFWAGTNFVMSYFDPFVLKVSGAYGMIAYDGGDFGGEIGNPQDRDGWYVQAKASYKTAYGTPIFGGWYASGDDSDTQYLGQGWIPSWAGRFHPTFGYTAGEFGLYDNNSRHAIGGTWGLQAGIEDVSFLQDLTHKFTVTWFQGTNDAGDELRGSDVNPVKYMTTNDNAVEFNLASTYQIYKNLTACLELAYIITDYDKGDHRAWAADNEIDKDSWSTALTFQYLF